MRIKESAADLSGWCGENGIKEIECLYGCSMGGSIVLRMLADMGVNIRHAVIDGGITPYQLPWVITRVIALRDFLMISMGKIGGLKLLQKAFATDDYSEEDLQYISRVLKMMSFKTIWRTFASCNNYYLKKPLKFDCEAVEYWYADAEEKERRQDIAYLRKFAQGIRFRRIKGIGHGGLAPLHPEKLVRGLKYCMKSCDAGE